MASWQRPGDCEALSPESGIRPGYGGQLIVIMPEKRLVAVQVVELNGHQRGIHSTTFLDLVRQIVTFAN